MPRDRSRASTLDRPRRRRGNPRLPTGDSLLDRLPGAVLVLDPKTLGATRASRGIERLGRRPRPGFLAHPELWLELVPEPDAGRVRERLAAAVASARPARMRFPWRAGRQGYGTVVEGHFTPIAGPRGRIVRVEAMLLDVTEHQTSEDLLLEAEARYRNLFEQAPDGLFVLDASLRFVEVNETLQRWLGLGRSDLTGGLRLPDLLVPEERQNALAQCRMLEGSGRVESLEVRMRRRDGTTFPTRIHLSATPQPPERLARIRGTVREIAHEHELLQQLYMAQRMESLGTLVGGVAHDFNNLLTAIRGYTELAESRAADDPLLGRYLADIREAADSATSLTRQLLAFGRRQSLNLATVDLGEVVLQFSKIIRRLIGEGIQLTVIPPPAPLFARVDVTQIHQVLMNLAVNARDAMQGRGRLSIEIARAEIDEAFQRLHPWARRGSCVKVAVRDSGPGVPEELHGRIFEPFFTTKEMGHGTGLGLAVAYGVVKQHEGFIRLDSAPGQGATFEFFLPLSYRAMLEERPAQGAPPPRGGHETLLVAEDDPLIRRLVEESLAGLGYRVLAAPDGEQAMRLFEERGAEVDLALLDLVMPGLGGREVGERMLARRPELRVAYLTGYSPDQATRPAGGEGRVTVIEKPCTPQALGRKVREILDARPRRVE